MNIITNLEEKIPGFSTHKTIFFKKTKISLHNVQIFSHSMIKFSQITIKSLQSKRCFLQSSILFLHNVRNFSHSMIKFPQVTIKSLHNNPGFLHNGNFFLHNRNYSILLRPGTQFPPILHSYFPNGIPPGPM
jgi:hypothetical protein